MKFSSLSALIVCAALSACASVDLAPPPEAMSSSATGTMRPYQIRGVWYVPRHDPDYNEVGMASWYGGHHQGNSTANGETFDMYAASAAHKTLPLPSLVEVKNLDNGRKIVVRVNDRGPFIEGRIIDLSRAAAEELDMVRQGVAKVRVRYLGPADRTQVARR